MAEENGIGYIGLFRELLNKPIWYNSTPEQKVILITLLLMANHQEKEWEWGGSKFKARPGQFVTSLDSISKNAGKGISQQNVRTALVRFKKLEFLTDESTKTGRLITLVNWDLYQVKKLRANKAPNIDLTNTSQTPNKDLTPNNNDKNVKNDKKSIYTPDELEILALWNAEGIIKHTESEPLKKEIAKALKKPGKENIRLAITQYSILLHDTEFYYSNIFTLINFLKQKNGLPNFLSDGQTWVNYKARGKQGGWNERAPRKIESKGQDDDDEWPISNSTTLGLL